jgi:3-dehydroquinate dehydratase-2
MNILILNGPNLNLLGLREPEIYGSGTYDDLCKLIVAHPAALGVSAEILQTNHEGVLVDWIQAARGKFDGIVLNPAAYTHTSVAILDAVQAVGIPTVEVHISDLSQREPFRQISYVRPACIAAVIGKGFDGYLEAMDVLVRDFRG